MRHLLAAIAALTFTVAAAAGQSVERVPLTVGAGGMLRVALDARIRVTRVGQPVTATVLDPVFVYDRVVIPAGTKAVGRVATRELVPGNIRARAMLAGDFTPLHRITLLFDSLVFSDGKALSIRTEVGEGSANVSLRIADASKDPGKVARAREAAQRDARQAIGVITAPRKAERLKDFLIRSLPYHPEYLRRGTVYHARLIEPLDFGMATPIERATPGTAPAPESILTAMLLTALSSTATAAGTKIEARLTQPVFSADHKLILPQGAKLRGEVTFTRGARRFRRNGQLRFLFRAVQVEERQPEALLASLYAVESGQAGLAVDEEGGAHVSNPKSRLIAPALGALALVGNLHSRVETDTDGLGPETQYGGVGSNSVGGFLGASLLGIALTQLGRPVTLALTATGLARSAYSAVFAKGRNVSFPSGTSIQIQLAPGPAERSR